MGWALEGNIAARGPIQPIGPPVGGLGKGRLLCSFAVKNGLILAEALKVTGELSIPSVMAVMTTEVCFDKVKQNFDCFFHVTDSQGLK